MQALIASSQDMEDFNNHVRMDDDGGPPFSSETHAVHQVHPFQEGFSAFAPGQSTEPRDVIEACPYKPSTQESQSWLSGFYNAAESLDYTKGQDNNKHYWL